MLNTRAASFLPLVLVDSVQAKDTASREIPWAPMALLSHSLWYYGDISVVDVEKKKMMNIKRFIHARMKG